MAETLKGKGVIWGTGAITCTGAVIESNDMLQGADFTWQSEKEELRDGTGEPKGLCYYNPTKTFTITVVPADDTIAHALDKLESGDPSVMLVAPGTAVVVTDPYSTIVDATANYILEQCRLRRTNTGAAVVEMDLIQYATDLSATVAS